MALVLLALAPLAVLVAYMAYHDLQVERAAAHLVMLGWSRAAAEDAEGFATRTKTLLAMVASDPGIARQDPTAASELLARLQQSWPDYDALWAARADGSAYADPRAGAAGEPANIGDQAYFQQAMRGGLLTFQTVRLPRPGGDRIAVVICQPVIGPNGQPIGTVQAILAPRRVPQLVAAGPLPTGAVITLLDDVGTIILHSANPDRWVGVSARGTAAAPLLARPDSTAEGPYLAGNYLLAGSPAHNTPWRAVVAIPLDQALAPWRLSLWLEIGLALGLAGVGVYLGTRVASFGRQGWEREALLHTLLEAAPIGIAVVSGPENRLVVVNPLYRAASGEPEEAMLGRTVREVFPEPMAEGIERRVAEVYRTHSTVTVREVRVETGGPMGTIYLDLDYVPLPAPGGGPSAVLMLATPVTEKVHARQQVEALAGQLQTILNELPDGVLVVDAGKRITQANSVAQAIFGPGAVGQTLPDLKLRLGFETPDGRPLPIEQLPLERALRGETVSAVELRVHKPDGSLVDCLASAAPLREPEGEGRIVGAVLTTTDITALKQAQAERERLLAEVERARLNLQAILDQLSDGVLVVDLHQRVTMSNGTLRRELGHDVVGMTIPEVLREYGVSAMGGWPLPGGRTPAQGALRGETVTGVEVHVQLPDGRRYDLQESAAPLRDASGRITGAVVTLTDITARKAAQAERERLLAQVQSARENLQRILDRLPDGVLVVEQDQRVSSNNEAIRRYLGRDLVGMTLGELRREFGFTMASGQPFPEGQAPIERALRGETITGLEVCLHLPDGRRLDALESVALLRGPGGQAMVAVVALTDITALKQAQAQVEAAREKLRAILDRLPEGIVVVDPSLHVTLANETMRRWAGRDIAGEPVFELWRRFAYAAASGQPFPAGQSPLERALRGEVVTGTEVRSRLADGRSIDILESVAPLRNPDGTVREAAVVLTDITPLKDLDRAKDEFISVAAHELRAPLTSLRGHAEVLLRRTKPGWSPEDLRSLETIDDQVDRLNDLIGRLLDVSRIRLGRLQLHRQPTDIVALARQVAEDMQVTAEAQRITVEAELPQLTGHWDAAALRQVLTNLIGNAIKYAPGSPIEVRIRQVDGQAVVSVSDHGPGIPRERLGRLFEAFAPGAAQEHRRAGGLGLGLYISRGIVDAHGGCIWVESQVGVGTTFTFTLPLDT